MRALRPLESQQTQENDLQRRGPSEEKRIMSTLHVQHYTWLTLHDITCWARDCPKHPDSRCPAPGLRGEGGHGFNHFFCLRLRSS